MENEIKICKNPINLTKTYVRAAHIYNIVYSHVHENFAIAGLSSLVEVMKSENV